VKAYRESTANLRNEAGADAAALECQGICETLHQVDAKVRGTNRPTPG
jgi:hypothetical protein